MKKRIGIFAGFIFIINSCGVKENMEKHEKAQSKSDYIMENFINPDIVKEFPEKNFPKEKVASLILDINANCDWKNRKGKFVDFLTINNNGKNSTAYIYEYFLKCDSLRFVLIYDMEKEEPELFKLNIEQLEQPTQMVIDPSKQLLNQK